jgi:hypothetical protein
VQEVGFPTRNEVEGAAGRSAQAQRGRLGCLLSRARDGVPQEAWLPCWARGAQKDALFFGWALRAGKGPLRSQDRLQETAQKLFGGSGAYPRSGGRSLISIGRWYVPPA